MQFWGTKKMSFICSKQLQRGRCSTPDPTRPDPILPLELKIVTFMVTCAHGIDLGAFNHKAMTDLGAWRVGVKKKNLLVIKYAASPIDVTPPPLYKDVSCFPFAVLLLRSH